MKIEKETAIRMAVSAMENCMAYITLKDMRMAATCYGAATVWDEMLFEGFGYALEDENEHYAKMLEIYAEESKKQW